MPLSDAAAVQAAADGADVVALFYGGPGAPLPSALQALAPRVRQRGARLVAVLQRDQAGQRTNASAPAPAISLFTPMPKDQFVSRLEGSVGMLELPEGSPSPVAVATRNAASRVDEAKICAGGNRGHLRAAAQGGDTVRLSWGGFQSWGRVVRGSPSAHICFAGLAPDEELKIFATLAQVGDSDTGWKACAAAALRATPPGGSPPVMVAQRVSLSAPVAEEPSVPAQAVNGVATARSAPAAGPPPGSPIGMPAANRPGSRPPALVRFRPGRRSRSMATRHRSPRSSKRIPRPSPPRRRRCPGRPPSPTRMPAPPACRSSPANPSTPPSPHTWPLRRRNRRDAQRR